MNCFLVLIVVIIIIIIIMVLLLIGSIYFCDFEIDLCWMNVYGVIYI